ncbi:MAG: DUF3352 domain-containing protein [Rubripirellula sp.]|nr:DUF3352 domain-containing protein [Rubripirellula sp.]
MPPLPRSLSHHFLAMLTLAFALAPAALPLRAQSDDSVPGAPRLLPEDTLAYLRIDNAEDLRGDMADSSIGRMLNDPQVQPFASEIYRTVADLFDQFASAAEISMDDLLAIPRGQVALALMPKNISDQAEESIRDDEDPNSEDAIRRRIQRKRRDQNGFAGVFIIDAGKNVDDLVGLIDRLESQIVTSGYVRRTTSIKNVTLVQLLPPRQGRPEIEYFKRDGTIVFGIGSKTASKVLDHWLDRSDESTLADRADFSSVMARCVGAEGTRPQLTFFVDPYNIIRRIVNQGGAAALVWPLVENLGVGKIRGMGGSSFRGGEVFDDIMHLHVLIDPPRDGIFGVLRPETGDSTPPQWVPNDVTSYTSMYWDFETTYDNVGGILEIFNGADAMTRLVEQPVETRTGVALRDDVIGNMAGRYVTLRWIEPPIKLNSTAQLHAVQIKDKVQAKQMMANIRDRFPNEMQTETIGGYVAYTSNRPRNENLPETFRQATLNLMLLDDWIVFSDSRAFLERVTQSNRDGRPRLLTVPEYELVSSELGGKLDGEKPFMVSFLRSSDYIRQMYELVKSPETQRFVRQAGQNNPVAAKVSAMLENNQLPPFEELKKYFAPSGTFAYDEPSGMHLGSFTLRADE